MSFPVSDLQRISLKINFHSTRGQSCNKLTGFKTVYGTTSQFHSLILFLQKSHVLQTHSWSPMCKVKFKVDSWFLLELCTQPTTHQLTSRKIKNMQYTAIYPTQKVLLLLLLFKLSQSNKVKQLELNLVRLFQVLSFVPR